MGAETSCEKAHFTYLWTIENGLFLTFGKSLPSPIFTVKSIEMTKWSLRLSCSDMDVRLFFERGKEDDGPEEIDVDFELSFLSIDGLPLIKKTHTHTFLRSSYSGFLVFAETDEVFSRRRLEFLPKGTLTVRCRMWKKGTGPPQSDMCFARTSFGVNRHRFLWTISDFNSLPQEKETTFLIKPASGESPQLTLIFCSKDHDGKIDASFDLGREYIKNVQGIIGEIVVLNADGSVKHTEQISKCASQRQINLNCLFSKIENCLTDEATISTNELLSLRCEFEIFFGPLWSGIENCEQLESCEQQVVRTEMKERHVEQLDDFVLVNSPFREHTDIFHEYGFDFPLQAGAESSSAGKVLLQNNMSNVTKKSIEDTKNPVNKKCLFEDLLYRFYTEKILTDVELQTSTSLFPAHKLVLGCRSAVFRELLKDSKAEISNYINIPENADTVHRLLLYIYTNEVKEMQWESATDLLKAADEYELFDLKEKCLIFLKSIISSHNFYGILYFANIYHENELFNAVVDFISHDINIFNSEAWKLIKSENPELALNVTERIICTTSKAVEKASHIAV